MYSHAAETKWPQACNVPGGVRSPFGHFDVRRWSGPRLGCPFQYPHNAVIGTRARRRRSSLEDMLGIATHSKLTALVALACAGVAIVVAPAAWADEEVAPAPGVGSVQVAGVDPADNADPAAVTACAEFAQVLEGSSYYFGEFADSFEGSDYNDPAVQSSNELGRQAMRESAGAAMTAAGTPGLSPAIAEPMRAWSLNATAMWAKMGLRIPGESLNTTATKMNDNATLVQEGCAASGTHA